MEKCPMKKLALTAAALTLGITAASAQSQFGEGGTVMLTPEQRAAVRSIIKERLPDELREKLADRLADRLETLPPEQRSAVWAALRARLAEEGRGRLCARLLERTVDLWATTAAAGIVSERVASAIRAGGDGRIATLTPEQRAAVRSIVRERLPDE